MQRQLSYDEYLALEQSTGVRHEFVDGEVFAMAGGTLVRAEEAARAGRS